MRTLSYPLFIFCALLLCESVRAGETVYIGGYVFPPFVEELESGVYSGLSLDLMDAMNRLQNDYLFKFVPTSPQRRYVDFKKGKFDMILFEDIQWGWQNKKVKSSKVFLKGGEVYIAKKTPDRTQDYFDSFEGKKLAGFLGYHYGFAKFNADPEFLQEKFNMRLSTSHEGNILRIVMGRIDVAIVTKSYLKKYLKEHPDVRKKILISDRLDQEYNHAILIRDGGVIDINRINDLLDIMEHSGVLQKLWKKYGLIE